MASIVGRMARGAAWMVAARLVDRSIGLVSTIVLARLLLPTDFGLVAMATSIIAALALLGAFNFDLALIQHPHPDRRHFDTVWTLDVSVAVISALALLLLAIPAASFYREPRLSWVMIALAAGALIGGFQNVGVVAFRKELNFDREFKFLLGPRVLAFAVTIVCAIAWRNYWALVAGTTARILTAVLWSYVVHPYRPKLSLAARGELFQFSKWLFVNNLLNFVNSRASDFIIGRVAGTHSLGVYGLALEVSSLPTTDLSAPIQRAAYPGYAAMARDLSQLREGFLDVLSGTALFVIPAAVGIVMVADPMVRVVLGPKWLESIALIQILGFYGLAGSLSANAGYVFLAIGRPRVLTFVACGSAIVLLPALILVIGHFGILGTAYVALAVMTTGLIPLYGILLRTLHVSPWRLWLAVWRPLAAAVVMAAVVYGIEATSSSGGEFRSNLLILVSLIAAGICSYAATVLGLWWLSSCPPGGERFILHRVRKVLARSSSADPQFHED